MAEVRVGIVSWNTAPLLERCLALLPAALDGLDAEVVVVDNASTDGSAEVAERCPGVRVVRNPANLGYARAMDQALAGTDARVLVALNPDTEPAPGTLAALVGLLLADPTAGVAVPRLVGLDGRPQHSAYRFPSLGVAAALALLPRVVLRGAVGRRLWLEGAARYDRRTPVDWAIGAVHAIRTEALAGEAPYSERWFMYAEDIELCWRLARRGWATVLEPDVVVVHVGNAAGELAWGTTRSGRYWRATYDLVATMRGRAYARALGALNLLAVARHALTATARGRLRHDGAARATARELWRLAPVHLAALWHGVPPGAAGSAP